MPIRESSQSPRPPVNGAARARPARNGVHSIRNGTPRREAAASIARRLFGTDGVRGVANVHPMTAEMALQLGRALAYVVRNGKHRHRIVIGKDTRLSGYMLETGARLRHLLDGRRRDAGRAAADARHRVPHRSRCAPTPAS